MSRFIQPLEGRTMFTATSQELTSDLATIRQDAQAVRVAYAAERHAAVADRNAVVAALRSSTNKSSNATLVRTLDLDAARNGAKVTVAQAQFLAKTNALSTVATTLGKALLAHPTNTTLQARFTTAVNALNTQVSPLLTNVLTLNSSAYLAYSTDMSAIDNANASNGSVVTATLNARADVQNKAVLYQTAANQVGTDVGTLVVALNTVF